MIKLCFFLLLLLPVLSQGRISIPITEKLCEFEYIHDASDCGCYFFNQYKGVNSSHYQSASAMVCGTIYGQSITAWLGSCLTIFPEATRDTIENLLQKELPQRKLLRVLNTITAQCYVGEAVPRSKMIMDMKSTLATTKKILRLGLVRRGWCSFCFIVFKIRHFDPSNINTICSCWIVWPFLLKGL